MASSNPKPVFTGYPAAQPDETASPTGTAYPYHSPPPRLTDHPPPLAAPPPGGVAYFGPAYGLPARTNTLFLRRLLAAVIAGFLIAGAVTFIVWLVLRPRLPELSVSSAAVSSFNISDSPPQLSSGFDVTLSVYNPNKKMSVYYDHIVVSVLYGPAVLSETALPPFYQGRRNSTTVRARLAAVAEYVDPDVTRGIAEERAHGGAVGFILSFSAWVRFRAGGLSTSRNVLRAYCDDVTVRFANGTMAAGSLAGPPKRCEVNL